MISANAKYKNVIWSFKRLASVGQPCRMLNNNSSLKKKHDQDYPEYNVNTSNWSWYLVDNNKTAGEKFVQDLKLDGLDHISKAAERFSLGWPEASKWNWTGEPNHYGESKRLSVSESIKLAQQHGKYMAKAGEESKTKFTFYEEIENEAREHQLHENLEDNKVLELSSKDADELQKVIERIKKKHREAILYYEEEILKHESALRKYIKQSLSSVEHLNEDQDENEVEENESYWMQVLEATEGKTTEETNADVQRTGAAFVPLNLEDEEKKHEEQSNLIKLMSTGHLDAIKKIVVENTEEIIPDIPDKKPKEQ